MSDALKCPVACTLRLCGFRYVSRKYYEENPELKKAIDQIHDGFFSPDDLMRFHDLTYQLLNHDRFVRNVCVLS